MLLSGQIGLIIINRDYVQPADCTITFDGIKDIKRATCFSYSNMESKPVLTIGKYSGYALKEVNLEIKANTITLPLAKMSMTGIRVEIK